MIPITKFVAELNGSYHINIPADRMELHENLLRVYLGTDLVALVDATAILTAHISQTTQIKERRKNKDA